VYTSNKTTKSTDGKVPALPPGVVIISAPTLTSCTRRQII